MGVLVGYFLTPKLDFKAAWQIINCNFVTIKKKTLRLNEKSSYKLFDKIDKGACSK